MGAEPVRIVLVVDNNADVYLFREAPASLIARASVPVQ
jgi:hypothetical protein